MNEEFTLRIEMGNDAMQTPEDVAETLEALACWIRDERELDGPIRDVNGNPVGEYGFASALVVEE